MLHQEKIKMQHHSNKKQYCNNCTNTTTTAMLWQQKQCHRNKNSHVAVATKANHAMLWQQKSSPANTTISHARTTATKFNHQCYGNKKPAPQQEKPTILMP